MHKPYRIPLSWLMALLPLLGNTQTCKTQTIKATAPTTRYVQYSNGTVLDKYTGLMWKTCSEGQLWNAPRHTCNFVASEYPWQQALQQAQKVNANGGYANYKDWRVPNSEELRTLAEEQCYGPAINLKVFPATEGDALVWSSDHDSYINFLDGGGGRFYIEELKYKQVRLVRGGR